MKVTKIAHTVKRILENFPETRSNDNLLILKVWATEKPSLRNKEYIFIDFAVQFIAGNFTNTESIRRSRQKLQEEFKNLRGSNYKARQKHQEVVKEDLRSPEILAGGTP